MTVTHHLVEIAEQFLTLSHQLRSASTWQSAEYLQKDPKMLIWWETNSCVRYNTVYYSINKCAIVQIMQCLYVQTWAYYVILPSTAKTVLAWIVFPSPEGQKGNLTWLTNISILHQKLQTDSVLFSRCECGVLLTQVTLLSAESRELLLEGVVVPRGSRDEQQSPLRHEPKQP